MGLLPNETIDEWLKREQREHHEEASIRCPYCNEYYWQPGDDSEDIQDLITYHAEDGPVEVECLNEHCEKSFWVTECVERTYEVRKTEEDDD